MPPPAKPPLRGDRASSPSRHYARLVLTRVAVAAWARTAIFTGLAIGLAIQLDAGTTSDPPTDPDPLPVYSVEQLTERSRPSLVTITVAGREGGERGLGTGFAIEPNLIVTNLHVIGEGVPFQIERPDGTKLPVTAVRASDFALDLAVIEVAPGETSQPVLPLGTSADLAQGAAVVVLGNPLGFKHSVVAGVVSAKRTVSGRPMLQLAMPIEPGNSGGPVLDMQGRVVGLVNMKSTIEQNLGFAIEVDVLKSLLTKPNPIAIDRWTTIGGIDPSRWEPLFGASWRQRAGRIQVSGAGAGFGGRSLCLAHADMPQLPFEVGVLVKLNDESGAAGLVFHADGHDRHYGFYPSNGNLRLSCFQGPDVQSWQVLQEQDSPHYARGEWNHLKVRVETGKLSCFVNGKLVIESTDTTLTSGRIGLAKFRQTEAEFKQFQLGPTVGAKPLAEAEHQRIREAVTSLPDRAQLTPNLISDLSTLSDASIPALRRHAAELEQRAVELRQAATDVHTAAIVRELELLVANRDEGFDLLRAALWVAKLDDEDIDVDGYIAQVDRMAADIVKTLPAEPSESAKVASMNQYLFQQNGYHGSRFDYYHRANSLMNRVIDDRAGLPITLSILYLEIGRRLGLKIEGVGLPAHFVVRWVPSTGDPQLIDVFEQGATLSREQAAKMVLDLTEAPLREEHLAAQSPRAMLRRLIANLTGLAADARDAESLLRLAEARLAIDPDSMQNRVERYRWRNATGRLSAALSDLDWLLEKSPPGLDLEVVRAARQQLQDRLQ